MTPAELEAQAQSDRNLLNTLGAGILDVVSLPGRSLMSLENMLARPVNAVFGTRFQPYDPARFGTNELFPLASAQRAAAEDIYAKQIIPGLHNRPATPTSTTTPAPETKKYGAAANMSGSKAKVLGGQANPNDPRTQYFDALKQAQDIARQVAAKEEEAARQMPTTDYAAQRERNLKENPLTIAHPLNTRALSDYMISAGAALAKTGKLGDALEAGGKAWGAARSRNEDQTRLDRDAKLKEFMEMLGLKQTDAASVSAKDAAILKAAIGGIKAPGTGLDAKLGFLLKAFEEENQNRRNAATNAAHLQAAEGKSPEAQYAEIKRLVGLANPGLKGAEIDKLAATISLGVKDKPAPKNEDVAYYETWITGRNDINAEGKRKALDIYRKNQKTMSLPDAANFAVDEVLRKSGAK